MATVTRTNPTAIARGVVQATRELTMMKVVLNATGLAQIGTDALASKVTDTLGSVSGLFQLKANGTEAYLVVDGHAIDIDSVAQMIGSVLDTGTLAGLAGGVQTLSDGNTVTVTVVTDMEAP